MTNHINLQLPEKNHNVTEPSANNIFSEQVHLGYDSLKFTIIDTTSSTYQKIPPLGKHFFVTDGSSAWSVQCYESIALTKVIDTNSSIV